MLLAAAAVEWPAFGRQAMPHPLDVLRSRKVIGELCDRDTDIDVVEPVPVEQFSGHNFDLVVAEPAAQQREQRKVVSRWNTLGIARA